MVSLVIADSLTQLMPTVVVAHINIVSPEKAVSRLSRLIKLRTVSDSKSPNHAREPDQFQLAHQHLEQCYPEVWAQLSVETVKLAVHAVQPCYQACLDSVTLRRY